MNQALEGVQVISAEQVEYVESAIARSICKFGLRTLHERKQYLVTQQKLRRFICRKRIFAFAVNYMLQLTLRHKGIWTVQAVFHWFCKGSLSQYWKGRILKLFLTLVNRLKSLVYPPWKNGRSDFCVSPLVGIKPQINQRCLYIFPSLHIIILKFLSIGYLPCNMPQGEKLQMEWMCDCCSHIFVRKTHQPSLQTIASGSLEYYMGDRSAGSKWKNHFFR